MTEGYINFLELVAIKGLGEELEFEFFDKMNSSRSN